MPRFHPISPVLRMTELGRARTRPAAGGPSRLTAFLQVGQSGTNETAAAVGLRSPETKSAWRPTLGWEPSLRDIGTWKRLIIPQRRSGPRAPALESHLKTQSPCPGPLRGPNWWVLGGDWVSKWPSWSGVSGSAGMLPRLVLQGPGAASISTTLGATRDCHHGLVATGEPVR